MADTRTAGLHARDSTYLRKIKKPIIEKKRRDRINHCLTQLKDLLLKTMNNNVATQVSKLDKADILEMTVSHLKQVQYQQMAVAMTTDPSALSQYHEGYAECQQETVRYLDSTEGSRRGLSSRVDKHLSGITDAIVMPVASSIVKSEPLTVNCSQVELLNNNSSSLLMPVPVSSCVVLPVAESSVVQACRRTETGVQRAVYDNVRCPSVRLSPSQTPEKVWRPW